MNGRNLLIKACDVAVGNLIMGIDGAPKRIIAVSVGMPRNTIELRWHKGWMAVPPGRILERVIK